MVRIFKLSWLIMAVAAVCMMCYSCNNGGSINDDSNNAVENESAEKIMKDSLDAMTELFDKAALISTTNEYVDKNTGESITNFYCSYVKEDSKYYYFDEMDYIYKYEKKDVEVRSKKTFAISSNALDKWIVLFKNSNGEEAKMFKIDYNGYRIEGGYKCVVVEENGGTWFFGKPGEIEGLDGNIYCEIKGNDGNIYYNPECFATSMYYSGDNQGKYFEGTKLQYTLSGPEADYDEYFTFDAESRTIDLDGTLYTFNGLVRNK